MVRRRLHPLLLPLALLALAAGAARAERAGTAAPAAEYDLVVVGAGPAGLVSALSAARELRNTPALASSGRAPRILVVEKRGDLPPGASLTESAALEGTAFARQQILGVRPEVSRLLRDLGVDLGEQFRGVVQEVEGPDDLGRLPRGGPKPVGKPHETHTIQINVLQARLLDAARAQGIEVRFDTALTSLEPLGGEKVDLGLETQSGERLAVRSRWIIGADGARSAVRRLSGMAAAPPEPQGVMVGVWFRGVKGGNRILYRERDPQGRSGVLIGGRLQLYGLFALPPALGAMVTRAEKSGVPLTGRQRAAIMKHCLSVARELLPPAEARRLRPHHMQPFKVTLERARSTVSRRHRALLIGDATRTVNPYTGSGANSAMLDARDAVRAIAEVERSPTRRQADRVLHRFNQTVEARSKAMHAESRRYAHTFLAPRGKRRLQRAAERTQRARATARRALRRITTRSDRAPRRGRAAPPRARSSR